MLVDLTVAYAFYDTKAIMCSLVPIVELLAVGRSQTIRSLQLLETIFVEVTQIDTRTPLQDFCAAETFPLSAGLR